MISSFTAIQEAKAHDDLFFEKGIQPDDFLHGQVYYSLQNDRQVEMELGQTYKRI